MTLSYAICRDSMYTLLLDFAHTLTFDSLPTEEWQDNPVQIRGFAYQTAEGRWILSPDPQLKSCCIGSPQKMQQQIVLEGNTFVLAKGQAFTVQGDLHINSSQATGLYTLANAQVVTASGIPGGALCLAGVLVLLWISYKTINKQRTRF